MKIHIWGERLVLGIVSEKQLWNAALTSLQVYYISHWPSMSDINLYLATKPSERTLLESILAALSLCQERQILKCGQFPSCL